MGGGGEGGRGGGGGPCEHVYVPVETNWGVRGVCQNAPIFPELASTRAKKQNRSRRDTQKREPGNEPEKFFGFISSF